MPRITGRVGPRIREAKSVELWKGPIEEITGRVVVSHDGLVSMTFGDEAKPDGNGTLHLDPTAELVALKVGARVLMKLYRKD